MIRRFLLGILGASIVAVAVNTVAVCEDKVDRRDRKTEKTVTVSGTIVDEKMSGITMKGGGKETVIPANDIIRIYYDDVPIGLKLNYQNMFNKENDEKDLAKVLKEHKDFQTKVLMTPDVKPHVKRYLEFRIAMLSAATAETDEAKGLARELEEFVRSHSASWEYPFAARALVRMHLDKLDYDAALKILDSLARSNLVPAEIKQEADLMLIDVMFQANKTEEVKAKINLAMNDARTTEAQKARFRIYQIGLDAQGNDAKIEDVVKKLDDVVAKTPDNTIKALAYNIMGDCYMQKDRKRDAMWAYLWVDVVYSQDKAEHMKAMTKLLSIFDEEKDNEKVQLYKDKIARLK